MRIQYTIKIKGLMRTTDKELVEERIRDIMRLKSIKTSRKTGECVIVTAYIADEYSIKESIENLGFKVLSLKREPYIKKHIFDFLRKAPSGRKQS